MRVIHHLNFQAKMLAGNALLWHSELPVKDERLLHVPDQIGEPASFPGIGERRF